MGFIRAGIVQLFVPERTLILKGLFEKKINTIFTTEKSSEVPFLKLLFIFNRNLSQEIYFIKCIINYILLYKPNLIIAATYFLKWKPTKWEEKQVEMALARSEYMLEYIQEYRIGCLKDVYLGVLGTTEYMWIGYFECCIQNSLVKMTIQICIIW